MALVLESSLLPRASFALTIESALKFKEVSYLHAEGMSGGFLKHGTIALIDPHTYNEWQYSHRYCALSRTTRRIASLMLMVQQ